MKPMRKSIMAMILAGGKGTRLGPLTQQRSKPAVPFGGKYRIIDFVLSNFVNSGVYSIYVLTQFMAQSLMDHLRHGWNVSGPFKEHFIVPVPAQMRTGESWYKGTADAIYQNLNLIKDYEPELVAVFGGDHVYKMDVSQMIRYHVEKGADITIAGIPVPVEEAAGSFGVLEVDDQWQVVGFQEKPAKPKTLPQDPTRALASMGNYIFNRDVLVRLVREDAENPSSSHDFGKDVLPTVIDRMRLYVYDFKRNRIPGTPEGELNDYWRDVGTIDSYFEANMDLRSVKPIFNLYNPKWPIRTATYANPPIKFVHDQEGRRGSAINSILCDGCIVSGSMIHDSIIGRNVHVHSYSDISNSIIMDYVEIGEGVKIRRAIIDKNVKIPPGEQIGYDLERDRSRFFVTESGIVLLSRAPRVTDLVAQVQF